MAGVLPARTVSPATAVIRQVAWLPFHIWEFPKIRGTVPDFGVLIMGILLFRVLY